MGKKFKGEKQEAIADIKFDTELNKTGKQQPCVFATCQVSGNTVGPVWGTTFKSVRRALCMLGEECDCGIRFHKASNGEDDPNSDSDPYGDDCA